MNWQFDRSANPQNFLAHFVSKNATYEPICQMKRILTFLFAFGLLATATQAATVLVEAESFKARGGWKLDTQFIEIMGSPYLIAHGLGKPVEDASTTVLLPKAGKYQVWVRTKDWVAPWKAPGTPGEFKVSLNGKTLEPTFGTVGANWHWQAGGSVSLPASVKISLKDLKGFGARCDAIMFSDEAGFVPPNSSEPMAEWRMRLAGLPTDPVRHEGFDLVVVGGGYGGLGSAISAARMGCKVALIQNRPVLGGNGSSEIRVWAKGNTRRGEFFRLGEIIEEFADHAKASPGTYEEYGDARKEAAVRREKNISLFLNHHAFRVESSENEINAVWAFDTRSGQLKRFTGRNFVDSTGHGYIGLWAKADHTIQRKGHLGMSNMWAWENAPEAQEFPTVPWALELGMEDFPYPRRFHGEWFWESGYNLDPLNDLELIRDWNHRAVFGAFAAMKHNPEAAPEHRNARLTWVAYIGGNRESTQLMGDVVLTQEDIVSKRRFPDGTVPTTWSIDLHYPKEQYMKKYPDNPFIAKAVHGAGVDRRHGYPLPYRSFYSRNIENLFMAGRNISVTHEALGTIRVMRTGGMIGEVVGKAASLCTKYDCTPAAVYHSHLDELLTLCRLPGVQRRDNVNAEFYVAKDAITLAEVELYRYQDPAKLKGLAIDDLKAKHIGPWRQGRGLKGYVGDNYSYAPGGSGASARYEFKIIKPGKYQVRFAYQHHPNRAPNAKIFVHHPGGNKELIVDMTKPAPIKPSFYSLGEFSFAPGKPATVEIVAEGAKGNIHSDCVQLLPVN